MSAATEFAPAVCIPARAVALAPVPNAPERVRPARDVRPEGRAATVSVLHAPADPVGTAAPVRLTRRGVVVLAALVAVVAGALLWVAAASAPSAASGDAAPAAPAGSTVTVHDGDTLWSIAIRVAPQRDPRAEVDALQRANHLDGVDLVAGQQLRVP